MPMCATALTSLEQFPTFVAMAKSFVRKDGAMENIVMTLLVRRRPEENAECQYAVQMTLPREMCPGEITSFTSVRLIHKKGIRSPSSAAIDSYDPEEWRAADLGEQALYAAQFGGNPSPWYCVTRNLCKSVYDYPGSGNKDTNNGQVWQGVENLYRELKTERKMLKKCEEELDAEWNMRVALETKTTARSGGADSAVQWAWRQIAPP